MTQPSSFSNSVIDTVTTRRLRPRSRSAVRGVGRHDHHAVAEVDDGGAVLLRHRQERGKMC